jgi:hypothetical protein
MGDERHLVGVCGIIGDLLNGEQVLRRRADENALRRAIQDLENGDVGLDQAPEARDDGGCEVGVAVRCVHLIDGGKERRPGLPI